jgi:hypothetical protein
LRASNVFVTARARRQLPTYTPAPTIPSSSTGAPDLPLHPNSQLALANARARTPFSGSGSGSGSGIGSGSGSGKRQRQNVARGLRFEVEGLRFKV